jgi:TonB-dependent starch-binding outer membrane protein SusC
MKITKQTHKVFLKIMRISVFQMVVSALCATFALANDGKAQELLTRRISLDMENASVGSVLRHIGKQASVRFMYSPQVIQSQRRLTLKVKNETLEQVLSNVLDPLNVTYKVAGDQLILSTKEERKQIDGKQSSLKQLTDRSITGHVKDEKGDPLPGVSVVLKGTQIGASTGVEGNYSLTIPDSDIKNELVLVFSFVGYKSQELPIGNSSIVNLDMHVSDSQLAEVVVVGYGLQKKASLTSAVVSISTDDIRNIPTSQLSNSLAGRLPGAQIIGNSGLVGANSSIKIRGASANPLYVIDNVITDKTQFDVLDPNEVETITVLKDAAAAAIYGARASGGVVLITTKKGKVGKVKLNYSNVFTTNALTRPLQTYTAEQEVIFMNNKAKHLNQASASPNPNFTLPFNQEALDYAKTIHLNSVNDEIWQNPGSQQHNLSASGGSENVTYFFSTGFNKAKGSYHNTNFDRFNFRAKVDAKITKHITLSTNLSGNKRATDRFYWPSDNDNGEGFTVADYYRSTFNLSKLYPFYMRPDGTPSSNKDPEAVAVVQPGWGFNPAEVVNGDGYRRILYNTFSGISSLNIEIPQVKGLSVNFQGNYRIDIRNQKDFVLLNKSYRVQTVGNNGIDLMKFKPLVLDGTQDVVNNLGRSFPGINESFNLEQQSQINGLITYVNSFGKHNINAFAGFEQAQYAAKGINGSASELLSEGIDQILSASTSTDRRTFNGSELYTARLSYLGRINYNYADKYIAEFSFRKDGSYKFAPGKRFGFFPSVSAAWTLSEEKFFHVPSVSHLKLRGSIGQTGSDDVAAYQYQNNFVRASSYQFASGYSNGIRPQAATPNPNITWETNTTYNAGIDLGMFKNKLDFTFDIFKNKIGDILAPPTETVPGTFGSSLPSTNGAEREIRGFEAMLSYRDKVGAFTYTVGANVGFAKDKWISYPEASGILQFQSRIGKPNNRQTGYVSKGIIRDQATLDALPDNFTQFGRKPFMGRILYEDIKGAGFSEGPDGKVDANDVQVISDNTIPRMNYGFNGSLQWKGIGLDLLFQGVGFYDKFIANRGGLGVFQQPRPYFELWTDAWSAENPNGKYPRAEESYAENGNAASTFWKRNGSYLRLKNVNISYSVPSKFTGKIGIDRLSVFVNGTNLFVLSKFGETDPEQETLDSYPLFKTFSGGINFSF